MQKKIFSVREMGYKIIGEAVLINSDLLVSLTGGNVPHIGGIVSWDGKRKKQEEIKFASHDGRMHKDILLAERFAEKIENDLPGNLCVTAGIHIDGISEEQINASFSMTDKIASDVLAWVNSFQAAFLQAQYTTHIRNFKLYHN